MFRGLLRKASWKIQCALLNLLPVNRWSPWVDLLHRIRWCLRCDAVSLIFIGAARPSIADPFLPLKINEGRTDDIRECIGCNICYSGDSLGVPIRCTQNPTMGEEWRRGWHPENIAPKGSDSSILVVGAGPAGLEATRALGQRGYQVMLAEASTVLGGRVAQECKLPGLAEWGRVRDYRVQQIQKMVNVDIYPDNRLSAEDALGTGG